MKLITIFLLTVLVSFSTCSISRKDKRIFSIHPEGNNLKVLMDERHLTTLNVGDDLYKHFFWPVNTMNGIVVTRGYPFKPVPGEPVDHPHQTGIWFTFGDVNGMDFWNNSDAIPAERKYRYGKIWVDDVRVTNNHSPDAAIELSASWKDNDGNTLLLEKTLFSFGSSGTSWSITRNTSLTADTKVVIKDNKEGLFAIRLAREFQFDTGKPDILIEPDGSVSTERKVMDEGKQGMYKGSNGTRGKDTWGTSNEWVEIFTYKDGDTVSVLMVDHPDNFGFPAIWHARDYGLFSVNNFGGNSYRPELPVIQKNLEKGESLNLKHRIVIKHGGSYNQEEMDELVKSFHRSK